MSKIIKKLLKFCIFENFHLRGVKTHLGGGKNAKLPLYRMYNKKKVFLILILILAFGFRFYGINWDQDHHLHPDERMITMVVEKIRFPKPLTLNTLLTPQSSLNPKFFAYGSFPMYLLKFAGNVFSIFDPVWAHYQGINLVGRFLSVLFDLGTIIVIYKISKRLLYGYVVPTFYVEDPRHRHCVSSVGTSLLSCLFYALSVLAIQTSHFYVVDVPLTFFITLTLYLLIKLTERPCLKYSILTGVCFGLALASKVSSILLIVPILVTLVLIFIKKRSFSLIFKFLFVIFIFSILFFILAMPYALIDFPTFWRDTLYQSGMTKDAFVFPYTLQFVGTVPYLYHLKNMVLWGMGGLLGITSVLGSLFVTFSVLKRLCQWLYGYMVVWLKKKNPSSHPAIQPSSYLIILILLSFFWPYFLITGSFAVKFMRYMLPIYPLFCIFGGILMSRVINFFRVKILNIKNQRSKLHIKIQKERKILHFGLSFCILIFAFCIFLWPLAFASIYSRPHSRITASEWINENIPQNSLLAVEHWDDHVPMWGEYQFLEMPMYEPDASEQKWKIVNANLEKTDYIIIASNRLYVPLMKLTDCQNLPSYRCYPKTNEYYQKLFDGTLGFSKIAEFTSYPTLPHCYMAEWLDGYMARWLNCYIVDDSADESFTVYDHPKVMIFKKK